MNGRELYTCGMSQRDISKQIKNLYDVDISPELVSKISLGVWIGAHESSKSFLSVPNDLKCEGIWDVYLFCTDGLCSMMEAIQALYPYSRLQRCIVHQIRSSTRFVSWKDIKQVVASPRKIYTAVTLDEVEEILLQFGEKRRKQYPSSVKSREENRDVLSTFYEYPAEVRKIIYTTNIIEGLNRQFWQSTKSFTNDDSLRRMLYLASRKIVEHWTARCRIGMLFWLSSSSCYRTARPPDLGLTIAFPGLSPLAFERQFETF